MADAGARAQHQSEEHFRSLQKRLGEEHDAYRREMQKAQDTVSAETSRLQTQVTALGGRIAQLDDTACRLESGMETRLSQMASDQISAARVQLESAVDVVLKELGTRNAKELDRQLEDARGKLKIVQKGSRLRCPTWSRRQGQPAAGQRWKNWQGFRGTLAVS